ncbi:cysteine--tRNA ligase [Candidatus Kaiserbacteria bacterium]|nr:cysteine--tRNA ligase [Candidatus Kaiserbacteria bacterium]
MFRNVPHKKEPVHSGPPLLLYNTLGKELQQFTLPERINTVRMYNCGPTVYGVQHIGNLSMFIFTDVLRRTLEKNGFPVKQVINITDFGHLTSDADEGEDKMTKGLKREKMQVTMENMALLAERYTQIFFDDLTKLNIDTTKIEFPRASAYIPAQIAMIKALEEKGYAYRTQSGVYFDTSRFPAYGALGGIDLAGLREGARVAVDESKHHPTDFMLWKTDDKIGWDSPWGLGFPGWHIECSAMIRATLGEQIDIHTGGIEHIPVHHNNEIAQSEAATGKKPFSRFWMHRAHIQIEGGKIAKSGGNVVYLSEIIEKGYHPFALRYLFLGAHYRTNANFSWEALAASQTALAKLFALRLSLGGTMGTVTPPGIVSATWRQKFMERINDDLDTPGALAVLWEMIKDTDLSKADLLATLLDFDRVLGFGLAEPHDAARALAASEMKEEVSIDSLPENIQKTITERELARSEKRWDRADELRTEIELAGYTMEDGASGLRVFKK